MNQNGQVDHQPSRSRICLVYTGGTIGMVKTERGLRPPENPADFLRVAPELKRIVDFDYEVCLNKDSTNMTPLDWTKMARFVHARRDMGYSGFVIAHGTDTMHFSSSALAFAFGENLSFPIVFTGAQTTPQIPHGDARINLVRACEVALTPLREVVISFGDYIFRGCRVQKKDERRFDAFESPGYFPIGHISEEIELHPNARTEKDVDPARGIEFRPDFATGIFQVALIPGLDPRLVLPSLENDACKGLMLQSFGWGNVPDQAPYSFEWLIRKAVQDLGKPVIIVSQFPAHATRGSAYEPGIRAVESGAIPTGNMTNAAAAAKFSWVLAQIEAEIREGKLDPDRKLAAARAKMQYNYVQEMD